MPDNSARNAGVARNVSIGSWLWIALRMRTLSLAVVPVAVGTVLAWAEGVELDEAIVATTLSCALCIQAGTNLFNDAGDALRGNDGPGRLGPQRVTASGLASADQVM